MKTLNKITSLTMAVIMLITATPVLQASDFAVDLNNAELKKLRKEISVSVSETLSNYKGPKSKKPLYEGIPSAAELRERHNLALENYKMNLKINAKDADIRDMKKYVEELKEAAKKMVQENPDLYDAFGSEKEKERVAFYTVLYDEMNKAYEVKEHFDKVSSLILTISFSSFVVGAVLGVLGIKGSKALYIIGIPIAIISLLTMIAAVLIPIPVPKSYFNNINISDNSEMIINKMKEQFLEDPFMAVNVFNKGGVDDFALFYIRDESCAQLLYDVVDIEYFVSKNQSLENMHDHLYTQTVEWHYLDLGYKANYLHNLANRLRAEAK